MKVAYISGPYRAKDIHAVVQNIRQAERAAIHYWQEGYAVICPHTNTALMDGAVKTRRILAGDLELLRRADLVVMLPGWTGSRGSRREYNEAKKHGIEITWWMK